MTKKILITIAVLLAFGMVGIIQADVALASDDISFIWDIPGTGETLQGVDGVTSTWSSNGVNFNNLGTNTWNLLGGTAWVNGYGGSANGTLLHRGPRGLGIVGGEVDEVDSVGGAESIEIVFNQAQWLNSLEVRSLYNESPAIEHGAVDFWISGSSFYTLDMYGTGLPTTDGASLYDFSSSPAMIDKLVFYVPSGEVTSEFSVAKLNVTATPEPVSAALFLIGGVSLAVIRKRRKNQVV
jgi:hypothetical protein